MESLQKLLRFVRQHEGKTAGKKKPARPRRLQPASQQCRQFFLQRTFLQVVFEVIEEEGQPLRVQKILREEIEAVAPGILRFAQHEGEPPPGVLLVSATIQSDRQEAHPDGAENAIRVCLTP